MTIGQAEFGIPGFTDFTLIGRGGFAVVYRALDSVGRVVAVKVINQSGLFDESARLDREVEAVSRVAENAAIVGVLDTGRLSDGRPFLVMDYVEGGSLQERVQTHGPLTWAEGVALGRTLAGALETAHRSGVVHCDVKPANVLLNPDVNHPQLADFGIASLFSLDEATLTQSSAGTPCYLPPEALDGERPEPRRDVYSLGATLQYSLSGLLPFTPADGAIFALMKRIATEPPLDLRAFGVPDPVATVIGRALAKAPEDRHATAEEFGEQLRIAAEGGPVVAAFGKSHQTARPHTKVSADTKRKRRRVSVAGLVCVLTIGTLAFLQSRGSSTLPIVRGSGPGDGEAAIAGRLAAPSGIAVAPDGTVYVADTGHHRVRRIAPNGIIETVAGNGTSGLSGDGASAVAAQLASPLGVDLGKDGSLYIADTANHRIRRVSPDGVITTVAGFGDGPGFTGEGSQGQRTQLAFPSDVAVAADGTVFIAEWGRIRQISARDGTVTTVAGTGEITSSRSDGSALSAQVGRAVGIDVAPNGAVIFVDQDGGRVRSVARGVITTVAGNGDCCGSGDGGRGKSASLWFPSAVAVGKDGSVFVAEKGSHVVRRIRPDGVIVAFAGTGKDGSLGDDGPALAADLDGVAGVAVGPDGEVYVADTGSNRVRVVGVDSTIRAFAGMGK